MQQRATSWWRASRASRWPSARTSPCRRSPPFTSCCTARASSSPRKRQVFELSTLEIEAEVKSKLDAVRATLARAITGKGDVCLTCSFQAEDVLLTKLAVELDPKIPVLFLDTGYHFAETYAYRDRMAR